MSKAILVAALVAVVGVAACAKKEPAPAPAAVTTEPHYTGKYK